jgi:hypothetical protein
MEISMNIIRDPDRRDMNRRKIGCFPLHTPSSPRNFAPHAVLLEGKSGRRLAGQHVIM